MVTLQCCICRDPAVPVDRGLVCSSGEHLICTDCVAPYINSKCSSDEDIQVLSRRNGRVYCPFSPESAEAGGANAEASLTCNCDPYEHLLLAKILCHVDGGAEVMERYMQAMMRVHEHRAFERFARDGAAEDDSVSIIPNSWMTTVLMKYCPVFGEFLSKAVIMVWKASVCGFGALKNRQKQRLARESFLRIMPRARQCGRCGLGPIDHSHCSDLRTHHQQRVGRTHINNSCPRCGWFANDINAWPRWNGSMDESLVPVSDFYIVMHYARTLVVLGVATFFAYKLAGLVASGSFPAAALHALEMVRGSVVWILTAATQILRVVLQYLLSSVIHLIQGSFQLLHRFILASGKLLYRFILDNTRFMYQLLRHLLYQLIQGCVGLVHRVASGAALLLDQILRIETAVFIMRTVWNWICFTLGLGLFFVYSTISILWDFLRSDFLKSLLQSFFNISILVIALPIKLMVDGLGLVKSLIVK